MGDSGPPEKEDHRLGFVVASMLPQPTSPRDKSLVTPRVRWRMRRNSALWNTLGKRPPPYLTEER